MKKDEAERGIRYLCHQWAKIANVTPDPKVPPDFGAFLSWVENNHHAYLDFRSTTSIRDDVEQWFDQEFKQTWRN